MNSRFISTILPSVIIACCSLNSNAQLQNDPARIDTGTAKSLPTVAPNLVLSKSNDKLLSVIEFENSTLTIQNNKLVGEQIVDIHLLAQATSSIEIYGEQINPGEVKRLSVIFPDSEITSIPVTIMNHNQEQILPISLSIPTIRSDLDTPTLSIGKTLFKEGNDGTTKYSIPVSLSVPIGHRTSVNYLTEDDSAISKTGEARVIAYDQFNYPFISTIESGSGGRVYLDAAFPKMYSQSVQSAALTSGQRLMINAINWVKDSTLPNSVLLIGDLPGTGNYTTKGRGYAGFNVAFSEISAAMGIPFTYKDVNDFGGAGRNAITLEQLQEHQAVIFTGCTGTNVYTPTTAKSVEDYFKLGGGLIFLTDHDACQVSLNYLLRGFGVQFYGLVNRNSDYDVATLIAKYGDHPLYEGLSTISGQGSEGIVNIDGVPTLIADYLGTGGELIFEEGEVEQSIDLTIFGDKQLETDEQFLLKLFDEVGINIPSEAIPITIENDD